MNYVNKKYNFNNLVSRENYYYFERKDFYFLNNTFLYYQRHKKCDVWIILILKTFKLLLCKLRIDKPKN